MREHISLSAVLHAPRKLVLEERPIPQPGPGEVLVEVDACAMCGSDIHLYEGHFIRAKFPVIPGHEFAGRVVALGPDVEDIALNTKACIENHAACGTCGFCKSGRENLCRGARSIGFNVDGAYSQHVVAPAKCVIPLPEEIDDATGAVMQTLGTAYHAVMTRARIEKGETVVIMGMGPVGLCALSVAKIAEVRAIVVDGVEDRLKMAHRMGADESINISIADPVEEVRELTSGHGADAVLEIVGGRQQETIRQAIKMLRRGGRAVAVGSFESEECPIPILELQDQEKDLLGSRGHPNTFRVCIELVAAGKINVRPIITHTLPLGRVERGIQLMRERQEGAIKIILAPQKSTEP